MDLQSGTQKLAGLGESIRGEPRCLRFTQMIRQVRVREESQRHAHAPRYRRPSTARGRTTPECGSSCPRAARRGWCPAGICGRGGGGGGGQDGGVRRDSGWNERGRQYKNEVESESMKATGNAPRNADSPFIESTQSFKGIRRGKLPPPMSPAHSTSTHKTHIQNKHKHTTHSTQHRNRICYRTCTSARNQWAPRESL